MEDQFKPAQNVTITAGLRVDIEELTGEGPTQFYPGSELSDFEQQLASLIPLLIESEVPGGDVVFQNRASDLWPEVFTGFEDYAGFEREMQNIACRNLAGLEEEHCRTVVTHDVLEQSTNDLETQRARETFVLDNTNLSPFLALAWSPGSYGKTAIKASIGRHYDNIPLIVPLKDQEPVLTDINYSRSFFYP